MRTLMRGIKQDQRGAVSLFVVVFSALLITIVTISFVQIMLRNQQEATTADLSQSAYDSALAGVEDAKRALVSAATCSGAACDAINASLNSNNCNSVAAVVGDPSADETLIQQTEGDKALAQAYTCVKVERNTSDLEGTGLNESKSTLIPLKGESAFDRVEISWKLPSGSNNDNSTDVDIPSNFSNLPRKDEWPVTRPAILRAQLVQFAGGITLSDFDSGSNGLASDNARTKFLYPSTIGIDGDFNNDSGPTPVKCNKDDLYSCKITLALPNPKGGSSANRTAFLRLAALYNSADYKLVLKNGDAVVKFAGIQAKVDSTGRAGDLFRRVSARVNLQVNSSFPYPEAAIDLDGNLCKTFRVTDNPADYDAGDCKSS
jgi:Tfp pilus assembly protein PilX